MHAWLYRSESPAHPRRPTCLQGGQGYRLYIDARLAAETNRDGGRPLRLDQRLHLCGRADGDPSRSYEGALSQLALFDRALGQDQVQELFDQVAVGALAGQQAAGSPAAGSGSAGGGAGEAGGTVGSSQQATAAPQPCSLRPPSAAAISRGGPAQLCSGGQVGFACQACSSAHALHTAELQSWVQRPSCTS
jgi:hypothetical protein